MDVNPMYFFGQGSEEAQRPAPRDGIQLSIRQQPSYTKVAIGNKDKDRKTIEPPPVIEIKIDSWSDPCQQYMTNPFYFMICELLKPTDDDELPSAHLLGQVTSSCNKYRDDKEVDGAFFIFPDLSVKEEGRYRLQFTLFETFESRACRIGSITSDIFTVSTRKNFTGMAASTKLTMAFSEQGCKVRVRREPSSYLRVNGPSTETYSVRPHNKKAKVSGSPGSQGSRSGEANSAAKDGSTSGEGDRETGGGTSMTRLDTSDSSRRLSHGSPKSPFDKSDQARTISSMSSQLYDQQAVKTESVYSQPPLSSTNQFFDIPPPKRQRTSFPQNPRPSIDFSMQQGMNTQYDLATFADTHKPVLSRPCDQQYGRYTPSTYGLPAEQPRNWATPSQYTTSLTPQSRTDTQIDTSLAHHMHTATHYAVQPTGARPMYLGHSAGMSYNRNSNGMAGLPSNTTASYPRVDDMDIWNDSGLHGMGGSDMSALDMMDPLFQSQSLASPLANYGLVNTPGSFLQENQPNIRLPHDSDANLLLNHGLGAGV